MNLLPLFATHFVADFLLQSRKMGQLKSSKPLWLLAHISIIFLAFCPFGIKLSAINAGFHLVIDAVFWNVYKLTVKARFPDATPTNFKYWEDHLFYSTIGLDQMLHYACIYLIFS